MAAEDQDGRWHLDKRVPLALMVTIILQTAAAVWAASSLYQRVEQLERQMTAAAPQGERLIRLEEKLSNVEVALAEIKGLLREPSIRRPAAGR